MCYDLKASLEAQKSRAQRSGNLNAAQEIEALLRKHTTLPQSHLNGFNHPVLGLYTNASPDAISLGRWGLIPHWFQGPPEDMKFNTLNARGESMLEKAAFATAAEQYRGILFIDGFYEHQHRTSGVYPHFIYRKDQKPMALACICAPLQADTASPLTLSFSIVTIKANALMSEIHHNPKIKEARMPLILTQEMEAQWLEPTDDFLTSGLSVGFITQSQGIELRAHTVAPLRKKSINLTADYDASAPFDYPESERGWDLFSGLN